MKAFLRIGFGAFVAWGFVLMAWWPRDVLGEWLVSLTLTLVAIYVLADAISGALDRSAA